MRYLWSLDLPYSLWTAQRLADVLAEEIGIRVTDETVRHELHAADIVLSRPQPTMTSSDSEYHVKKAIEETCGYCYVNSGSGRRGE